MVVGAVVSLDAVTKTWANGSLPLAEPRPVLGDLARLRLGFNSGVAFGLLQDDGGLVTAAGLVASVGLAVWLVRLTLNLAPRPHLVGWGLVLGGALANLLDRLPDGRVTDLFDLGLGSTRWPTFNLADASIVLGVLLLLTMAWSGQGRAEIGNQRRSDE